MEGGSFPPFSLLEANLTTMLRLGMQRTLHDVKAAFANGDPGNRWRGGGAALGGAF